jgi:hypothetical protein
MKKDDPYAGLYVETDKDPYAGLFVVEEPKRTGLDLAGQYAGITTGVLAPYATAAGAGALAGAPFAGIGAIPGAAGGVLSLGAVDLGTALYNLGGSFFGAESIPLPSQTIRDAYKSVGIGRDPETANQQVYNDVLEAGTSAFSQGKAAQNLFKTGSQPVQNFMREMGKNIRGQTVAGTAAGAAPSVASNYFDVTNPYALTGLSLASGVAGGKFATPKTKVIPSSVLKEDADAFYKQMRDEGIEVSPQAMTDLVPQVRTRISALPYDPDNDEIVNQALKMLDVKSGKPLSFDMLDKLRRKIRDLPYNKSGGSSVDTDERAIIAAIDDAIDDYMDGLTPAQVTSGDPAAAAEFLTKARTVRGRSYQTDILETAVTRATDASSALDATKSFPKALREEFRNIYKNKRALAKFDKPTQALIKQVAEGTVTQKVLMALGKLAPSASQLRAQLPQYGLGYSGMSMINPTVAAIMGGVQAAGAGSRGIANQMTKGQVNRALANAGQPGAGVKPSTRNAMAQTAQQTVLAQDRANESIAIPAEMQAEMNDWFNRNPRGAADIAEYANFRRELDAKYGFALDIPYENDPGIKYFVDQYNNPKADVSLKIPKVNKMRR